MTQDKILFVPSFLNRLSAVVIVNIFNVYNTELNDLRKIICLRQSEVSVEIISICNVIENLAKHGIHCLPCSYTNDVIDLFV